jgi:hypothetical protein
LNNFSTSGNDCRCTLIDKSRYYGNEL